MAYQELLNPMPVQQNDAELNLNVAMTGFRDLIMAQRSTTWADSLADGIAVFWTSTAANGGTAVSTVGEGQLKTATAATGSIMLTSPTINYYPGQVAWMNGIVRFGDTGTAGNVRRVGMFTVSGLVPQDGYAFELDGTTLYASVYKGGAVTRVASTAWTKVATAPYTLDTNYHGYEIRYGGNFVHFYIDNVLRHIVSTNSAAPITNTLNYPINIQNIKTSGATDITLAVRNIGNGRFGERGTTGLEPKVDGGLLTFHLVSAATTNATVIKATPGQVFGWFIYNSNAAARKITFHNSSTSPTAGAGTFISIVIPPTSGANVEYTNGIQFTTGIAITTTTGLADTDATAVALNDLNINIFYK